MVWERQVGMAREGLSKGVLEQFEIPLPPLPEQKRIVAKIDQLMALCDTLESQKIARHQKILDVHGAVMHQLLDSSSASLHLGVQNFLFSRFDELYSVKENVTELRKAILQLAVMGKLVPQDPKDQPASELLKEIEAEKKRLVKEGKIKAPKPLPEIKPEEVPYEVPKGWEWVRLGEITSKIGSGSTPRGGANTYVVKGVPFFRSQNIYNYGLVLADVAYITEFTHEAMSNTKVLPGDILLNITGASLGRSALVPLDFKEANVSQHVTIIRMLKKSAREYLHNLILSPFFQKMVWERQVGMAREGLSKGVLEQFEIPLPPLAEQKRIVAKIDQLMALCDSLEQGIEAATQKQSAVLGAVLAQV
jgi:type I restriction enzyme S subunit